MRIRGGQAADVDLRDEERGQRRFDVVLELVLGLLFRKLQLVRTLLAGFLVDLAESIDLHRLKREGIRKRRLYVPSEQPLMGELGSLRTPSR